MRLFTHLGEQFTPTNLVCRVFCTVRERPSPAWPLFRRSPSASRRRRPATGHIFPCPFCDAVHARFNAVYSIFKMLLTTDVMEGNVPYILRGQLCGFICAECPEPLSEVTVRL